MQRKQAEKSGGNTASVRIAALLIMLAAAGTLRAQFESNRRTVQQSGENNQTIIRQQFYANRLEIVQNSYNYSNTVSISQLSPGNTAAILQFHARAPGTQVTYVEQAGSGSNYLLQIQGDENDPFRAGTDNFSWARQDGAGNIVTQVQHYAGKQSIFMQVGKGNEGEQQQQGQREAESSLVQTGGENSGRQIQNGHQKVALHYGRLSRQAAQSAKDESRVETAAVGLQAAMIQSGSRHSGLQDQTGLNGIFLNFDGGRGPVSVVLDGMGQKAGMRQSGQGNQAEQVQSGLNSAAVEVYGEVRTFHLQDMGHRGDIVQDGLLNSARQQQSGLDRLHVMLGRPAAEIRAAEMSLSGPGHRAELEQRGNRNDAVQIQSGLNDLQIKAGSAAGSGGSAELAAAIGSSAAAAQHGDDNTIQQEQQLPDAVTVVSAAGMQLQAGYRAEARQEGDRHQAEQVQAGLSGQTDILPGQAGEQRASLLQTGMSGRASQFQYGWNNESVLIQEGSELESFQEQTGCGNVASVHQTGGQHRAVLFQTGTAHRAVIIQNGASGNQAVIRQNVP